MAAPMGFRYDSWNREEKKQEAIDYMNADNQKFKGAEKQDEEPIE